MSRYPRPDLSPVLAHHSIDEALADLLELDQTLGIIAGPERANLLEALEALVANAHDLGLTRLNQVVENSGILIAAASGISRSRHGQALASVDAERLHTHRNLLLALTLAGILSYRGDATKVAAHFTTLKPRTSASLRAHTDGEVEVTVDVG